MGRQNYFYGKERTKSLYFITNLIRYSFVNLQIIKNITYTC